MYAQGCKVKKTIYGVLQDPLTKSFPSLVQIPIIAEKVLRRNHISISSYISINLKWNFQLKQLDKQTRIKNIYPLNMKTKNPLHTKWLDDNQNSLANKVYCKK